MLVVCVLASGCAQVSTVGNAILDSDYREEKLYVHKALTIVEDERILDWNEYEYCFKPYRNAFFYYESIDYASDDEYCECFKNAYDASKKNNDEFVSLDVPQSLQEQHQLIASFLNDGLMGYYEQYQLCKSDTFEGFSEHSLKSAEYKTNAVKKIPALMELQKEWTLKYYGIDISEEQNNVLPQYQNNDIWDNDEP